MGTVIQRKCLHFQLNINFRASSLWIPGPNPAFDQMPTVRVTAKNQISKTKIRYDFELIGPDHMGIFVQPLNDGKIVNWSFHWTPLRMEWKPPYFVYFSYGINGDPLKFWIEIEVCTDLFVHTMNQPTTVMYLYFTENQRRLEYN